MTNHPNDEILTGGNVSKVYRSGTTVRRQLKEDSEKIHALLKHLEDKAFKYSPKFLGIDEHGREILSFIEGECGNYPLKDYMWSNEVLRNIAKMQRSFHDAVSDFPFDKNWKRIDNTPQPQNAEVLCHNDFAIYNIIFNKEKPIGIIDFDVVGPGPRLWDIAYTLYTCVPLGRFYLSEKGEKIDYDALSQADLRKERVRLYFESYGEKVAENLIEMILQRLEGLCKTINRKASEGDLAFQKMLEEGHVKHYQDDITFIRNHADQWI